MNSVLENKVRSLTHDEDVVFVDFSDVDEGTSLKDLSFHRVRGSVRLTSGRVLLPFEVNRAKKKVLGFNFS